MQRGHVLRPLDSGAAERIAEHTSDGGSDFSFFRCQWDFAVHGFADPGGHLAEYGAALRHADGCVDPLYREQARGVGADAMETRARPDGGLKGAGCRKWKANEGSDARIRRVQKGNSRRFGSLT